MNYLQLLLTGATAAAVVKLIDNVLQWHLNRKAKKEDKTEEKAEKKAENAAHSLKQIEDKTEVLTTGMMCLLLDRIQYLGRSYLKAEKIDFDDRRRLHQMHDAYHALGGNGDLNKLMEDINKLPLTNE